MKKKIALKQPESFQFSEKNLNRAKETMNRYPKEKKASALMPLLYLVQKQNNNWIPLAAMKYLANMLEIPYIQVYEVATFYSMYNLSPVGKYFVQVCTTTPCMISGAEKIVKVCKSKISQTQNELSDNKMCSWMEVECLGACINAPMMQINEDYYEDLNEEKTEEIINMILDDKSPKPGSYKNRKSSEPIFGRTTLTNLKDA